MVSERAAGRGGRGALVRAGWRAWLRPRLFYYLGSLLVGVLIWALAATRFSPLILPGPGAVLRQFIDLLLNGSLLEALWASLGTLLVGYGCAVLVGFPLGIAVGRYRALSVATEPVINAIYAVPPVALVPFLIIWFGLFLKAQIALVFLMAVFEIIITMRAGTRTVESRLIDAARSFGCDSGAVLRKVVLPAILPYTMTALRFGLVRALNGVITAQLLFAASSVGALMKHSMVRFDTAALLALVIVLSVIGLVMQEGMKYLEVRLMPWHIRA